MRAIERHFIAAFVCVLMLGCAPKLSPEQQLALAQLKLDRQAVQAEVAATKVEDARLAGGLIKAYIAMRLEILKINDSLLQQRIDALESGAKMSIVVSEIKTDPARAAQLIGDIATQRAKLAEAKAEADRYAGGLVQAMSLVTVATIGNTVAMLEQQQLIAKYGFSLPTLPATALSSQGAVPAETPASVATTPERPKAFASNCLKIDVFDSSVLSTNSVFTELAWKADVTSSCEAPGPARVTFTLYDKDEFQLDSDSQDVFVPAGGVGKARGKMLVSPPSKASRIARQGVSLRAN